LFFLDSYSLLLFIYLRLYRLHNSGILLTPSAISLL
jgi:hypothetical protein